MIAHRLFRPPHHRSLPLVFLCAGALSKISLPSLTLMPKRKADVLDVGDSLPIKPSQIRRISSMPVTRSIELTPREAQLKGLLLETAKHIDLDKTGSEPVVLRWAGGWVRDKLLGIQSHDIDTAINVMTGEAFTLKLVELCEKPEIVEKHNISDKDIGNLHKIAKNPERSKHLETATIRLFDFDVDFVNLRKETYTEDSRNPQMEFGTAEEDAARRDATINALFYNLNTGAVEDFTGGLADMESKLIRTPLEPFQTFMDDPLRVLRLIRFASRLQFTIDRAAEQAMGDHRVLEALRHKISRERVGIEVEKMLKGNHPMRSLQLVDTLGLYHTVFTDPTNNAMPRPEISDLKVAYTSLEYLRQNKTPGSIYDVLVRSDEAAYFAWILSALSPWAYVKQPQHDGKGKAPLPFATLAAREGIKATNKLCEVITGAERHRGDILELKSAVCEKASYIEERDRVGMAIREWDARGGHWRLQVLYALLAEAFGEAGAIKEEEAYERFLADWQAFLDHLQELDVMEAPSLKRLIDGTQLAKALGVRPGRWMAKAMDMCIAWQLRNPEATDPAGAVEEVRSRTGELEGYPKK